MLSFNNLGNLGRLANQMFQYASLKGIARNREYDFCIPPKEFFGRNDLNVRNSDMSLYDVFDLENRNKVGAVRQGVFQERTHMFDEDLFEKCPDNVDLFGYFQTEKYFRHIENEIRQDFSFKKDLLKICRDFIQEDTISLHIRRGDYVHNPNHPLQSMGYYKKALSKLPNLPVIVFSDDPDWCREQDLFATDRFMISEDNSTDCDLCLMSLCKYHVIANSSFSWWGAWLAKSEKVFAPQNWFGAQCAGKKTDDLPFNNFVFLG